MPGIFETRGVPCSEKSAIQVSPAFQEREDKAPPRRVDESDGLRSGRNVGHRFKCPGIEDPDPTRFVVRDSDQAAVVGDRAADRVARLDDPRGDGLRDKVELCQPAVASEDVGETLVRREHDRGVREIAKPFDPRDCGAIRLIDDQDGPGAAFDHDAKITGRSDVIAQSGQRRGEGGQNADEQPHCLAPCSR